MSKQLNIQFPIKYCPQCGESLQHPRSFINEFWISTDTAYFCWCHSCKWRGEIIEVIRVTAPDSAD
jgi:hypothetical protein